MLLDIGLPKLTGLAVMVKLTEINPFVKVIVRSGYIDPELKSKLFQAGVKEFVNKPYNPDRIVDKIQELLGL